MATNGGTMQTYELFNNQGRRVVVDDRNAAEWRAAGYSEAQGDPCDPLLDLGIRPEWMDAFIEAGYDTREKIAALTVDDLDALPVRGLGRRRAEKILEAARG
jgi:hypothetical protein